ncbi:MAG: SNF2-related protein [Acidimicrobiales bacterium]
MPLGSPQLLRDAQASGRSALAPWRVDALAFGPSDVVDVLPALARLAEAPAGEAGRARVGDSVRHLAKVVGLALELVARGRLLPAALPASRGSTPRASAPRASAPGGSAPGGSAPRASAPRGSAGRARPHEARWLPVLGEGDRDRIRSLIAGMPPICRAEVAPRVPAARRPTDHSPALVPPGSVPPAAPASARIVRDLLESVVDAAARDALAGRSLLPVRRGRRPAGLPSATEAWLDALVAAEPAFSAEVGEVDKLVTLLDEWRASADVSTGPVQLCLRLSSPAGDDEPWRLELLLQSVEDPSLLITAADAWDADGPLSVLDGVVEHPAERLLEGLGKAARLYRTLDRALSQARPEVLELDVGEAATFLREGFPLLEQAGFGVLVPPWWRRSRLGLRLRAKTNKAAAATSSGLLGMDGICAYRWEAALGDESLSVTELRNLARLKAPLVRVKGQWVELAEDDIAAALVAMEKGNRTGDMTAGEVMRNALGLGSPAPGGLAVVGVEADGWLGELLGGGADRKLEPIPTPDGFDGVLRPYQSRGLAWLSFMSSLGLGACLADDMGLGKTAQLLALLVAERGAGGGAPSGVEGGRGHKGAYSSKRPVSSKMAVAPTLVVCPMSLVGNWQREAGRFAPGLSVHVHHGAGRLSGAKLGAKVASSDLVLTTYALAARDSELLGSVQWGRIALDEAQNIKNPQARQTQAIRGLRAAHRVALTGTPVENRLSELWSILSFLNPGLLGSQRAFREAFGVPIERFGDDEAAQTLRRVTGPFILRRLKTDRTIIADLPDKLEMKVYCNLTREQATLYQAVVDDMLAQIEEAEGMARRGLVLATMMKLKQVCNHPAQLLGDGSRLEGRSGKLARLTETLEEVVAEGDKALVFTQFAEMGTMLAGHLADRLGEEVLWLHGGVPKPKRDEMVERFQGADGSQGPSVFLLSIKAGGTGLNLTAANHVVHFDRWWNPAVEDQATDRAFRIGQRRDVQVRKLVCVGTLEERIDAMIESKRELAERIVGTGEGWLTELSTSALRELVALSADAVAEG